MHVGKHEHGLAQEEDQEEEEDEEDEDDDDTLFYDDTDDEAHVADGVGLGFEPKSGGGHGAAAAASVSVRPAGVAPLVLHTQHDDKLGFKARHAQTARQVDSVRQHLKELGVLPGALVLHRGTRQNNKTQIRNV